MKRSLCKLFWDLQSTILSFEFLWSLVSWNLSGIPKRFHIILAKCPSKKVWWIVLCLLISDNYNIKDQGDYLESEKQEKRKENTREGETSSSGEFIPPDEEKENRIVEPIPPLGPQNEQLFFWWSIEQIQKPQRKP